MRNFFINNWIVIVIGAALVASMLVAMRNKHIIEENSALQKQSELVKELTKEILSGTMHGPDIGLRGFALTGEQKMLEPYKKAIEANAKTFRDLEQILTQQGYDGLDDLQSVKIEVDAYVAFYNEMIAAARMDSLSQVVKMLREDRGYGVWKK